jgi:hypothetical protein
MPENITIAAFILAAVMLLIAIVGGKFKIFGVEVSAMASSTGRIFAGVIGTILLAIGLYSSLPTNEIATQEAESARPSVEQSQQKNTKSVPGKKSTETLPTTFMLKELTSFQSQEKGGEDTVYLKWGSFTTKPKTIKIGDSIQVEKTVEAGTSVSLWELDGWFRIKDGDDDFLGEAKVQGNSGVLRFENPALGKHIYTLSFEPKR